MEPGRFDDVLSSLLHGNIVAGLLEVPNEGWPGRNKLRVTRSSETVMSTRGSEVIPHTDHGTGSSSLAAQFWN